MKAYIVKSEYADYWTNFGEFPPITNSNEIAQLSVEWNVPVADLYNQVIEFTGKYLVVVESHLSFARMYFSDSRNAMKAADKYGRCEYGETITVYDKHGNRLSGAAWITDDGARYARIYNGR